MTKAAPAATLALCVLVTVGCAPCEPDNCPFADQKVDVAGPYLGQATPGATPELFAPGVLNTDLSERDTAWSPDGRELYYTLYGQRRGMIVTMSQGEDNVWSEPLAASFSGTYSELEAFVAPSGRELLFASQRPLPDGSEEKDWDLWLVRRTGSGWSEPERLPESINTERDEFFPSVTTDGVLYFTASREDSLGGEDIYRSRLVDGVYQTPENLGDAVNSPGPEFNAMISPDESFLLYSTVRPGDVGGGDLYVAFRGPDGAFLPAVNLGPEVNSTGLDYCPALSPDGKYLFFSSRRSAAVEPRPRTFAERAAELRSPGNGQDDIYWVSAEVIERLRPEEVDS